MSKKNILLIEPDEEEDEVEIIVKQKNKNNVEDLIRFDEGERERKKFEHGFGQIEDTENKLLKQCNFASTSDSTSWLSPVRYGVIDTVGDKKRTKDLKNEKIIITMLLKEFCVAVWKYIKPYILQ